MPSKVNYLEIVGANVSDRFYQHFGFLPLPGRADRMLLPAAAFRGD